MSGYNGTVTYEAAVGGKRLVVKTVRGRITAKRVTTYARAWDHSGKRASAYHIGMISMRLLAYQVDGSAAVNVACATNVAPSVLVYG